MAAVLHQLRTSTRASEAVDSAAAVARHAGFRLQTVRFRREPSKEARTASRSTSLALVTATSSSRASCCNRTECATFHSAAPSTDTEPTKSSAASTHNGCQSPATKCHRKPSRPARPARASRCSSDASTTREPSPPARCNNRTECAIFHSVAKNWLSNNTKFLSPTNSIHKLIDIHS